MVVDIGDRRAVQACADVVPSEPASGGVIARVEAVAGEVGHIDPADEGNGAVDDHELLVVAVKRMLTRIALAPDLRPAGQRLHAFAHLLARGMERRHRRARPHKHPDVDLFGRLGQKLAEHAGPLSPDELERRRDVPPGDVDVVTGARDRLRDQRERLGAVDEHLELAALAGRRIAVRPQAAVGRVERTAPAEAAQAPLVLGAHRRLDAVSHDGVDVGDE